MAFFFYCTNYYSKYPVTRLEIIQYLVIVNFQNLGGNN